MATDAGHVYVMCLSPERQSLLGFEVNLTADGGCHDQIEAFGAQRVAVDIRSLSPGLW